MRKCRERDPIYLKRQFDSEVIVLCVRSYITYRLSSRDLVEMMAERGDLPAHTTVLGCAIRSRIRKSLEPLLQKHRLLMEGGRNIYLDQGWT